MKSNAISCLLIGQGWKQFSERKNILIFQLKSVFSTLILNSVYGNPKSEIDLNLIKLLYDLIFGNTVNCNIEINFNLDLFIFL